MLGYWMSFQVSSVFKILGNQWCVTILKKTHSLSVLSYNSLSHENSWFHRYWKHKYLKGLHPVSGCAFVSWDQLKCEMSSVRQWCWADQLIVNQAALGGWSEGWGCGRGLTLFNSPCVWSKTSLKTRRATSDFDQLRGDGAFSLCHSFL